MSYFKVKINISLVLFSEKHGAWVPNLFRAKQDIIYLESSSKIYINRILITAGGVCTGEFRGQTLNEK